MPEQPDITYQTPDSSATFSRDVGGPWKSDDPAIQNTPDGPGYSPGRGVAAFVTGALSAAALQPIMAMLMGVKRQPMNLRKMMALATLAGSGATGLDYMRDKIRRVVDHHRKTAAGPAGLGTGIGGGAANQPPRQPTPTPMFPGAANWFADPTSASNVTATPASWFTVPANGVLRRAIRGPRPMSGADIGHAVQTGLPEKNIRALQAFAPTGTSVAPPVGKRDKTIALPKRLIDMLTLKPSPVPMRADKETRDEFDRATYARKTKDDPAYLASVEKLRANTPKDPAPPQLYRQDEQVQRQRAAQALAKLGPLKKLDTRTPAPTNTGAATGTSSAPAQSQQPVADTLKQLGQPQAQQPAQPAQPGQAQPTAQTPSDLATAVAQRQQRDAQRQQRDARTVLDAVAAGAISPAAARNALRAFDPTNPDANKGWYGGLQRFVRKMPSLMDSAKQTMDKARQSAARQGITAPGATPGTTPGTTPAGAKAPAVVDTGESDTQMRMPTWRDMMPMMMLSQLGGGGTGGFGNMMQMMMMMPYIQQMERYMKQQDLPQKPQP